MDETFWRLDKVHPVNDDRSVDVVDLRDFVKILGHAKALAFAWLAADVDIVTHGVCSHNVTKEEDRQWQRRIKKHLLDS